MWIVALEKMTITVAKIDTNGGTYTEGARFEVQYNPSSIPAEFGNDIYLKTSVGENVPQVSFAGGKGQKFSIKLLFDSWAKKSAFGTLMPVTSYYEDLKNWSQTKQGENNAPHLLVQWGSSFQFIGLIETISEDFTLFKPDGTPLRAEVKVCFRQTHLTNGKGKLLPTNPTSRSYARKTWIVEYGQRLDWIAHQEYGDSAAWRTLQSQRTRHPQAIYPGQILKLTPR
ncbi:MAG: hypothetical protein HC802_06130 [Caldilineaceae bacterium]|nr:hypothetical protein [Caldilineaceae bacterium]